MQIPQAQMQGTGNLAIFNSLDEDVLLSYSSNLNTDDVIAVIGAKQKGVKVDISKRTSSIVTVFAFKMPAVQDYFKADCEDSQMPTAFMQSGFIPSAKSSFVIGTEESKSDYGILLILNKRSGLVSICQGSSRNKQIGVVQAGQSNYRIQIPIGYKQLVFYLHNPSGGIDFTKPVFSKNLVFNKGDTKLVFIPNKTIFNGAKIKFLNASAQDVMLMVRKSDSPLSNVECSCEVVGKQSDKPVMILVQDKYYADDFFFSVISLDTGQTLTESQPFQLDKKTNASFKLQTDLTLKKTDLGKGQVVVPNEKPSTPSEVKTSEVKASSVKVSWSPSADSDGEVAGYEVSYKTSSGSWTGTQTTTQTNLIVSGLQPETSYTFRIRAKDDENAWSAYEQSQSVKTPAPDNLAPSKPSTISTSQVTGSSIKVSWSAATDSDGVIANYEISYKAGDGFWTGTSMTASTTYTFQSLQPNTSYTFRVRAKDDEGDWSAYQQSTAVSTAPNAPTALAVSARSLTFMMTSGSSYECSKDAGTTKTNCNSPFSFGDDAIAELDPQSHFYPKISLVFFCTCARLQENVERGMCTNIFCFFKFLIQNNTMNMKFFIYSFLIVLVFGGCNWDNLNTSETSGFSKFSEEENEVSQAGTWNFDNGNKPNGLTGNWSVVSGGANSTSKSLKSANIGNNQQTCVQTTRNVSAGNVEFQYKVSSEQNYDELFFYIDSAEKLGGKSGNIGWTQASYAVSAGSHTFKWCYQKDDHVSGGSDAAWIDEVNFPDSSAANKKQWSKLLGSSSEDRGLGVSVDSSGNVYVTGYSLGNFDGHSNSGSDDMFLVKYDSSGNKKWSKLLGSSSRDFGEGVSVDSAGNVYVTGYSYGNFGGHSNSGYKDMFLVKYDSSGNKKWSKLLGSSSDDYGYGVSVDSSGNVYVTGSSWAAFDGHTNSGKNDMFLVKYDSSGNKKWSKLLGSSSRDYGGGVSVDSAGNVYVTGSSSGNFDGHRNSGYSDMFLIKYDRTGSKKWSKLLGSSSYDYGGGVSVDSAGNVYVTGYSSGNFDGHVNSGDSDMFLVKYDSSGNKKWSKLLGGSNSDYGEGVSVDSAGNVYVTGYSYGNFDGHTNSGSYDMFLVKYDSSGNKKWSKLLGSSNSDYGYGVSVDSSGNVYVTGYSWGNFDGHTNSGSSDMFLVKFGK